MFDVLITNGFVLDGTGAPGRPGDVAVQQGRIAAVGNLKEAQAKRTIDASGMAVAPGFIDIHTHTDLTLFVDPRGMSKVRQGVTTDVVCNCGSGVYPSTPETKELLFAQFGSGLPVEWTWSDLRGYRDALRSHGIGMNIAPLVGYSPLRIIAMGLVDRKPSSDDIKRMQRLLTEQLDQGAFGMSAGLTQAPGSYVETEELAEVTRAMAAFPGRFYASHSRMWAGHHIKGIQQAVDIGRLAGVPVQIAHLGIHEPQHHGEAGRILTEVIDRAIGEGADITIDTYPYIAASSGMTQLMPIWTQEGGRQAMAKRIHDPELRKKIRADMLETGPMRGWPWLWDGIFIVDCPKPEAVQYRGMSIQQVADSMGCEPVDAALTLMDMNDAHMPVVFFYRNEEDMRTFLKYPRTMMGSDGTAICPEGLLGRGKPHPRWYGAAARLLGRYVRQEKVLTLEDAVHKMTGMPADRLGLKDRGRLAVGQAADVVVFDPDTVIDRAQFGDPHHYPVGVPYVLVNGQIAIDGEKHTGALAGSVLEPR